MKKYLVTVFVLLGMFAYSTADAQTKFRAFTALTGGGTGALDKIPIAQLTDGDIGFTTTASYFYVHRFVAAATNAESSPTYIRPDDYATAGVWTLMGLYGSSLLGGPSATPSIVLKDSDATDGDDNIKIYANCTDTGSGTEDCDLYFQVQVAGTLTTIIQIDADGNVIFSSPIRATTIELGADTDTTLSRSAAGVVAVEGTDLVKITSTQVLNFGGATLEIPNSDDPDLSVEGQISFDTDGWLRVYNNTRQEALARVQEEIHVTVISPNSLADAVRDKFPVWDNASGMSFIVTEIEAWSDVDNSVFSVLEYAPQDLSSAAATIEASIDTGTTGTSVANVTVSSIDNATVENGNMIFLDFDDTDDPGWVKITIRGYYNADVN